MITACCTRALQRCTSRICVHFLLTFQEIRPISKTRNQLIVNGEVLLDHGEHTGALPGQTLRGPLYQANRS